MTELLIAGADPNMACTMMGTSITPKTLATSMSNKAMIEVFDQDWREQV